MIDFNKKFLIVVDLDYTLIDNGKSYSHVPKSNVNLIQELTKNPNFHLTIATGRSFYDSVQEIVDSISIEQEIHGVLSNGANLVTLNLKSDPPYRILETHELKKANELFPLIDGWQRNKPYVETEDGKIIKFYIEMKDDYKDNEKYKKFLLLAKETKANIYNFGSSMDVVGEKSTKGHGVLTKANQLNIEEDQVVVVGDSVNDLSMLKKFKNSFIVSNSSVIDIKPEHTTLLNSSNADGCLVEVMERVGYKKI